MNKLEKLETMMGEIACPNCNNSQFQIHLNCELPEAPSDLHAMCSHCNYIYFFTDDPDTMEEMWANIEEDMPEKGCPECGDPKIYLEFLCDVLSKDGFFLVRCQAKNHFNRLYLSGTKFLCHV